MQLLIIHDESALADNLLQLTKNRIETFHIVLTPQTAELSLDNISNSQSTLILFLALLDHGVSNDKKKMFSERALTAAKAADSANIPFVFLSSSSVFSGEQFNYEETAELAPKTQYGEFYGQLETDILKANPHTVILRSGWLFSDKKNNFLTQTIEHATKKQMITVNSASKGCPTALPDLARVLLAICLQLPLSDNHFGIYHYCSSDASIGFQFIETILTQAANFDAAIDATNILFTHNDEERQLFFYEPVVLSCQKLLDTFGIHQRPWRAVINETIKDYYVH